MPIGSPITKQDALAAKAAHAGQGGAQGAKPAEGLVDWYGAGSLKAWEEAHPFANAAEIAQAAKDIDDKVKSNLPKYGQQGTAIMEGNHHHGFMAKLPGPMKKYTGKQYGVFGPTGEKLGHVNGLQEAVDNKMFNPVGAALSPAAPATPPPLSGPPGLGDALLKGLFPHTPPPDTKAPAPADIMKLFPGSQDVTPKAQEPSKPTVPEVPYVSEPQTYDWMAEHLAKYHGHDGDNADGDDGSFTYLIDQHDAYHHSGDAAHTHDPAESPVAPGEVASYSTPASVPSDLASALSEHDTASLAHMALPQELHALYKSPWLSAYEQGVVKDAIAIQEGHFHEAVHMALPAAAPTIHDLPGGLPKYAQGATTVLHNGTHVGFMAKLPGPMKASTGKTHAFFDVHGSKKGYGNGIAEHPFGSGAAAAGSSANSTFGTTAPKFFKSALPPIPHNVKPQDVGKLPTAAPSGASATQGLFSGASTPGKTKNDIVSTLVDALRGDFWKGVTQDTLDQQWQKFAEGNNGLNSNVQSFVKTSSGWKAQSGVAPVSGKAVNRSDAEGFMRAMMYAMVNATIATWAATSNDHNPLSLAAQDIAAEKFGIPNSDVAPWQHSMPEYREANREFLWAVLDHMYHNTQQHFMARGITSVKVYRRMHINADAPEDFGSVEVPGWAADSYVGQTINPILRPLSSFSTSKGQDMFGPFQILAEVPVQKILSSAQTGFGCLGEYEVVVVGGNVEALRTA